VHLFETATGEQVDEIILRVNGGTAGGDLAWRSDGTGFYYTRYPRVGERPEEDLNFYQQLWFHKLGTPASDDTYVLGDDFPRTAEIKVEMGTAGRLLLTMQFGDSGRFAHYLLEPDGEWQQLTEYDDEVPFVTFGVSDDLFLVSRKDAPRGKIQKVQLASLDLAGARTIVAEGTDTIVTDFYEKPATVVGRNRLFVTYQLGGPSEIRVFDHEGKPLDGPEAPPVSSIYEIEGIDGNELLYREASYVEPPAWYRFDGDTSSVKKTALINRSVVDFSDCEVVRVFAQSKDGTRVPVNIMHRKGIALDGSHPVLLTGYGGYGVNIFPAFVSSRRVWIEQGGIFAEANIRGGGEFGETWHREGMLTKKQNCFDDFAAAMQLMIDRGYTSSEKLAIVGGSNGGLLMGAMVTQHPDLARAVVSFVGIYDMVRSELSPNGTFNIPEFGTVEEPDQFRALLDYSPYHNTQEGIRYPAILFLTGANDPRVDPMHSRKMTALLQASTSGDAPILLRTSGSTGHGLDTPLSERVEESVDWYGFLFEQLGVDYQPVQ
jgi:prolyl oligopeptidase